MLTIPELKAMRPPGHLVPHRCPHCDEALNVHAVPIVVATRNCTGCGRRVVAEPKRNDAPPRFTLEQLDAARQAHLRVTGRNCWVMLAAFLFLFAAMIGTALYRDTIRAALDPVADPGWVAVLILFLPLGLALAVSALLMRRMERAAPRCPTCSAPLHRHWPVTRLTGNCWGCGRRMLPEPPADEPGGPLVTVPEFQAAVARLVRTGNLLGLLVCGLFPAVFISLVVVGRYLEPDRLWQSLEDRHGPIPAAAAAMALITVTVLGVSAILILAFRLFLRRLERRRAADPVLNCPYCQAGLSTTRVVIASRRCPECRKRVLAEPEPAPAAVGVAAEPPGG